MNTPEIRTIKLSEVVYDSEIYPRVKPDPALIAQYTGDLDEIEAATKYISVSQNGKLLDGYHRWKAYLTRQNGLDCDIPVYWYASESSSDPDELFLAMNLNRHGKGLNTEDLRNSVLKLYQRWHVPIADIARRAGLRKATVLEWTKGVREDEDRKMRALIFDMYMACATIDEIAGAASVERTTVQKLVEKNVDFSSLGTKINILAKFDLDRDESGAESPDEYDWKRPLYNTWTFAKKSNAVSHFGNSEQRILENLLYLYTEPFDIVVDPFAGGGSTIDVCKRRLRRYFVSDRKPIIARENEIRLLDVATDVPPLNKRWSEVALTYLDPPYWKQAEGQYSSDAEDLANMPLTQFTEAIVGVVNRIADRQSHGAIALLIQPTQWKSDNRAFTDHVLHITSAVKHKRLTLENRVSCPYSTEQYNAQQVEWAKANKKLLVLTRELIIWRVGE